MNVKEQKKNFKKQRRVLIGISAVIVLLHTNLSILLNKVLQSPFSPEQLNSLSAILFVLCLGALIRYHQAAHSSRAMEKIKKSYVPYVRSALGRRGIVLDKTYQGESEYDDTSWHFIAEDEYRSYQYILEEDTFFSGSYLKGFAKGQTIKSYEKLRIRLLIYWAKVIAFIRFAIHEPETLDIFWPYFLGGVAVLEITGILKVSVLLQFLGHWFNLKETEPNISDICPYFASLA